MMEEDKLKNLINLDFKREVPSANFTDQIMHKIENQPVVSRQVEPLIPAKIGWVIAFLYAGGLLFLLILGASSSQTISLNSFDFFGIDLIQIIESLELVFSLLFVFAVLTLADMWFKKEKGLNYQL